MLHQPRLKFAFFANCRPGADALIYQPKRRDDKMNKQQKLDQLKNLATKVIAQAKTLGATAVEVDAGTSFGFAVNVRENQVETIEHSNGKELSVTVYFDKNTGSAGTSDFSDNGITAMLEKACYIARFTNADPFAGLADQDLMAYDCQDLDLDTYHPWQVSVDEAIDMAKAAEKTGFAYDRRIINSEGAAIDTYQVFDVYANSQDFCGANAATKHSFSCSFIAKDQDDDMQRDYDYTVAHNANDLKDINMVARQAAQKTVDRLNARRINTCSKPIIFAADVASSLIGNFLRAINGTNIYRKSSFLLDSLDKQVFAKLVNIEENPHLPKGFGSTYFDDEGVKVFKNNIIVDGVLQHYILDSYAARKLSLKTTGNAGGVHNLIVKPAADSNLSQLLRKMHTGLLVTELMGDGVNMVTGDYSRGVFGYWVENGIIQYPVTGATIASNLQDMFLNIIDIGNDIDYRGNILTGSILVDNMTLAGS